MKRDRRRSSLCAVAMTGFLLLPMFGCGFFLTKGPPAGYEGMEYFTCTESNAGPIVDVIWGGLNVLGAGVASVSPDDEGNRNQAVTVGLSWGVVSGLSAATGFRKTSQCRRAKQLQMERLARARGASTPASDAPLVRAVVVTPAARSLTIGERVQLLATAHSSSGAVIPDRSFTWSSSNDAIASVGSAGLVTAHNVGTVDIAANTGNVIGNARIAVAAPRRQDR
jgi:hypothetical protein